MCTVSKLFIEFRNPTPRARGRGGATSGAEHMHWSVRVGARRTLSEQSARPPATQLRHSGTGFVSTQFNELQHSSQNTQTFMFLSVLLYQKVLDSDRNLLAPMCAGSLLAGGRRGGKGNDVFLAENITYVPFSALPTCTSTQFRPSDVSGYGQPCGFLS